MRQFFVTTAARREILLSHIFITDFGVLSFAQNADVGAGRGRGEEERGGGSSARAGGTGRGSERDCDCATNGYSLEIEDCQATQARERRQNDYG